MSADKPPEIRNGFCIYIDTLCQGSVPSLSDSDRHFVVFETEIEAQREIVEHQITRLQQFLDGERDFADAMTLEEFVVPVTVHPNGFIVDEADHCWVQFSP